MKRKITVFALCTLLFALCVATDAQPPKRIPRIGYLSSRSAIEPREEAFRKGLKALGYVEGHNILIEWRFAQGKRERQWSLASDLVRLNVDCIIATGTPAVHAAKQATSTIPIIMENMGDDPVQQGFIHSLARPGGNITGFTILGADLASKRLEIVKEVLPKVSRVAILRDPNNPATSAYLKETAAVAGALGVQLQPLESREDSDLLNAFRAATKARAEAIIVVAFGAQRPLILKLTVENRLPAMYTDPTFVPEGGLMSYSADVIEQFRRGAIYVDKVLKGIKPADLPVEQPKKFEFIVNLKTANQIGLNIPPNVLARADKVIK